MSETDPVVGHKTLKDGTHLPLLKSEADSIMAEVNLRRAERASRMPDERSAINAMFDAWLRLKELGWREAVYCPKDGTSFDVIEPGSTGIHPCHYSGEWPTGYFMVGSDLDDYGLGRPVLFKLRPEDHAKYLAKLETARMRYRADNATSNHCHTADTPQTQTPPKKRKTRYGPACFDDTSGQGT